MDTLRRMWQAGFEAQHIEELISGVFADFAPYAGAEHRRLSFVRQMETEATAAVTVEDTGDMVFQVTHAGAGASMFTTTGLVQISPSVKIPLPPPSMSSPTGGSSEAAGAAAATTTRQPPTRGLTSTATALTPTPPEAVDTSEHLTRFTSTLRGAQIFFGMPAVARAPFTYPTTTTTGGGGSPAVGQIELEATIPALLNGRAAAGLRTGPFAARLSRMPTVVTVPVERSLSPKNSTDQNSGGFDSLADTINSVGRVSNVAGGGRAGGGGRGGAGDGSGVTEEQREAVVYTLDASVCMPLAELTGGGADKDRSSDNSSSSTRSPLVVVSLGLQHPYSPAMAIAGDTLVGLSIQNDRTIGLQYQASAADPRENNNNSGSDDDGDGSRHGNSQGTPPLRAGELLCRRAAQYAGPPPANTFRLLLVQTLVSTASSSSSSSGSGGWGGGSDTSAGGSGGSTLFNSTTGSRAHNNATGGGGGSNSGGSSGDNSVTNITGGNTTVASRRHHHRGGSGGGQPWHSLPTLIGCNVSFARELVRISAASIFHDGDVDVEAAAIIDVTQYVPSTPTLLKLGWNNTGRLAFGITSFFYGALSLTLGMHMTPGEEMRFGLEVKL